MGLGDGDQGTQDEIKSRTVGEGRVRIDMCGLSQGKENMTHDVTTEDMVANKSPFSEQILHSPFHGKYALLMSHIASFLE